MKKTKAIIPLLVLSGSMMSCTYYSVKPGPIKNLVGTYELVQYKMKHNEEDNDTYDRKEEIGAVAYFSVAEDGYAYYAYKDKNTAPKFATMFATFTHNSEEDDHPEYVRSIDMSDGVTHLHEDEKYVGCFDEPSMGFRNELFKKILHYNLSGHMAFQPERKIPYQYVQYKRVSKEASLSKVNELMGTSFTVDRPYETKALKGYLVYRCNVNTTDLPLDGKGLYDYAVIDANTFANNSFTVYYKLKNEEENKVAQIPVTIETKGYSFSVPFAGSKFYGEKQYNSLAVALNTKFEEYPAGSQINSESFTKYYSDEYTLQQVIDAELAYNNGING